MKKTAVRIVITVFSTLFIGFGVLLVSKTELKKQLKNYLTESSYLEQQAASWQDINAQYLQQIDRLRLENTKQMSSAKIKYEQLLSEQPNIIKQHTRKVAVGTSVTLADSSANRSKPDTSSTKQTQTTVTTTKKTQVVKVSKPKSAPATRAS